MDWLTSELENPYPFYTYGEETLWEVYSWRKFHIYSARFLMLEYVHSQTETIQNKSFLGFLFLLFLYVIDAKTFRWSFLLHPLSHR